MAPLTFRILDPVTDFDRTYEVFKRCEDYILMLEGQPVDRTHVQDYFNDHPDGMPLSAAQKIGIFQGDKLIGVIDLIDGYPTKTDYYLGVLYIADNARNLGVGKAALEWVITTLRDAGGKRLLLCVLKENTRAHAFWVREGFQILRRVPACTFGKREHIRYEMMKQISPL